MKVAYPVIFTDMDTNILIEVPDLGILTEANEEGKTKGTIADAIMMARDAIGISCIEAEDRGDLAAYRRMLDNKTVRRNVTLPNWLNQEAEKSHINVSKVLQEALMAKLGVSR